jgi:hypothetical protein
LDRRHNAVAHSEGKHNSEYRHKHGRAAHAEQLRRLHLQTDDEQQKHHTDFRKSCENLIRLHPTEHTRAENDTGENLTHDARLAKALHQLSEHFRGAENEEQFQR